MRNSIIILVLVIAFVPVWFVPFIFIVDLIFRFVAFLYDRFNSKENK